MIKIDNPYDCCGCTACSSVCPRDAIEMRPDALGFLYPHVYTDKCIDCGLCDKVCSFNDHYDTEDNFEKPMAFGARHKKMKEVELSQSGAAFVAISDYILDSGGVVYGCGYTDHFRVVHKRATNKNERDDFRGSKYVQSDLNTVFRQVKADLRDGLSVLFSGTPCQTAGLNSFIGKKLRTNLVLVDVVCHGVPGPFLWRDYIANLEKKEGAPVTWVNFRDKQFGWKSNRETFKFEGNDNKMCYKFHFYKHIMFRKSCSNCHFTNTHRPSDMTISDFWGVEKSNPEFGADNKGVSLILVNTPKGRDVFDAIKINLDYFPTKLDDCLQPNLIRPNPEHPKRASFERDYARKGFDYIYYKYGEDGWRSKINEAINRLKDIIRPLIKR